MRRQSSPDVRAPLRVARRATIYAFGSARMAVDGGGAPPFVPAPFPASLQTQLNGYLSTTPAAGSGVGPAAGAASFIAGAFNSAQSQALAGSVAIIFDVRGLIGDVVANPDSFGMTNATQACGFAGNGCDASTPCSGTASTPRPTRRPSWPAPY